MKIDLADFRQLNALLRLASCVSYHASVHASFVYNTLCPAEWLLGRFRKKAAEHARTARRE
jgi:hypothetical protein